MKYAVTINKRVRYLKTYNIVKRVGEKNNFITNMFIKMFGKKGEEENQAKATA